MAEEAVQRRGIVRNPLQYRRPRVQTAADLGEIGIYFVVVGSRRVETDKSNRFFFKTDLLIGYLSSHTSRLL